MFLISILCNCLSAYFGALFIHQNQTFTFYFLNITINHSHLIKNVILACRKGGGDDGAELCGIA